MAARRSSTVVVARPRLSFFLPDCSLPLGCQCPPVVESAVGRLVPIPYSAHEILKALQDRCQGRGVHLVEVGGGWQFRTTLDLASELAAVMQNPRRLPRAAMETLAIIAQYQPLTRTEIEDIRGAAVTVPGS